MKKKIVIIKLITNNYDNKKSDHRYTLMSTQKEKCREIIQNHINQLIKKYITDKHGTSDHSLAKLAGAKIDENKLNEKKEKIETTLKKTNGQKKSEQMNLDKSPPEEDLSKINYDDDNDDKNETESRRRRHRSSSSRSRSRSRSRSSRHRSSRHNSRSRSRHRSHHHSKRRRY